MAKAKNFFKITGARLQIQYLFINRNGRPCLYTIMQNVCLAWPDQFFFLLYGGRKKNFV